MKRMDFKRILQIKGLKYWVATAVFVIVIVIVDPNNLLVTMKLSRQVSHLHDEERELKEAIEHYGRENYYMKRADEDVFVIK